MAERELIEQIRAKRALKSQFLFKGIGDDCAVFGHSSDTLWLTSTDMLVEDVHFSIKLHPAHLLGRKTIAVNLSDIAAMGGKPEFVLLSVALSPQLNDEWVNEYINGVLEICDQYDCQLIGGDTVSSKISTFSVTVIGRAVGKPVYRSGAMAGDDIYVSGVLGSSGLGLQLLQNSTVNNTEEKIPHNFIQSHLNPTPQVELGIQLSKSKLISAMQDISDGIATDLAHICKESRVGAEVFQQLLPADQGFKKWCGMTGCDPIEMMLSGGEDYQLLFVAKKENRNLLEMMAKDVTQITRIGEITQEAGVYLIDSQGLKREVSYQGYEHL